jgi:hypothetical protein
MMIKSKISQIFGIIGFTELLIPIIILVFFQRAVISNFLFIFEEIYPIFLFSAWIFDIAGIIFGVKGLKAGEGKIVKMGILLSVLGLFEYLLLYFILAKMFGMGL